MYYTHIHAYVYILYIIKYIYKGIHTYKLYIYSLHSLRERFQIKMNYEIPKIDITYLKQKASRFLKGLFIGIIALKSDRTQNISDRSRDYQKHSLCSFLLYIRMIRIPWAIHIAQRLPMRLNIVKLIVMLSNRPNSVLTSYISRHLGYVNTLFYIMHIEYTGLKWYVKQQMDTF